MPNTFRLLILSVIFVLSACARPVVYTGEANGVVANVSVTRPLLANQSIPVTVTFRQDGAPLAVRDVAVELIMPGMTMGQSVPLAEPQADGSHTVDLLFTMDGEWALIITGKGPSGAVRVVIRHVIVAP